MNEKRGITRRGLLAGGAWLAGAALWARGVRGETPRDSVLKIPRAQGRGLVVRDGGAKPVYLPEPGTRDLKVLSHAENLFWNDILMEHAGLMALFLAGPELANERSRAAGYEAMFAAQLAQLAGGHADGDDWVEKNRSTIRIARPFVEFKHELRDRAERGKLRSLAFPSWYAHIAQEGERAVTRLGLLAQGQPDLDRGEVIGFWSQAMADHAHVIAHQLDPQEARLVAISLDLAHRFDKIAKDRPASADSLLAAVDEVIDFKTTTAQGLSEGKIRGALSPVLADHVRREAIKAADELRRVTLVHAGVEGQ